MSDIALAGGERTGRHRLPRFLRPPCAAELISDPQQIKRAYAHQRPRILFWSTAGYGTFYFVRKNLSVATPVLLQQLHLTTDRMGLIFTLHGVVYGVSKFLGGMLADRANARVMMALALAISAGLNICFGLSTSLLFFGIFWTLNGGFQGMGYPPCARLLTHWFSPKELATKMSYWNASHSLGGGAILILCGFLIDRWGNWRLCFFVPSVIALAMSVLLLIFLRDTPQSIGLPEVEGSHVPGGDTADESPEAFRQCLRQCVFSNKYIWLVSIANFFVYTIRFAVFDWGPTVLKQAKGITLLHGSAMVAGFEVAGLMGMLVTGILTDRLFGGRGAAQFTQHAALRSVGLSFLESSGRAAVAQYISADVHGFLCVWAAGAGGRDVGQPRHQAPRPPPWDSPASSATPAPYSPATGSGGSSNATAGARRLRA